MFNSLVTLNSMLQNQTEPKPGIGFQIFNINISKKGKIKNRLK